ncbi:MAG TPA: tetratricopeptide repeat protein [Bryobacteraceae bacterium]|nr:tetratricopeptide repeat protein [Bryobacteraceae bacterium]
MAKKPPPGLSSRFLPHAAAFAGIFCLVLLAYLPALNGGLVWDDDAHITRPELQSWHGLWRIWFDLSATQQYYPLLHSAFWLEHWFWGDAVASYHLANLVLHALSAHLLLLILKRLSVPGAWLAALIFALHPICVESVAWISEQKNTLSTVFYLSSAMIYLDFDEKRKRSSYLAALGLFVLALLSKSVTATLPAALLVLLWWRRGRVDWKRDMLPLAPWLAIGVSSGLLTAWVEKRFVGAEGALFALSLAQRCLLAGRAIWFYAAKVIWPANLMFFYPRWTLDPHNWPEYLFPLGVVAMAAVLLWLACKSRAPLAAFLFFTGALAPALGFINVYPFRFSYVADHFQYLASLGVIVPAAWAMTAATRAIPASRFAPFALVAALGILTWSQSANYSSAEALYRDTLARNPSSWLAEHNLGGVLMKLPGLAPEAIPHLEAALRLNPNLAEARNNLGLILSDLPGRLPDAIAQYQAALRIRPDYPEAHNNLGSALSDVGRREEAIAEYRAALRLRPNYAEAHNNLGSALSESADQSPAAIAEFEAALRIDPNLAEAQANLSMALIKIPGRLPEAISHLEAAVRIRPDMQPWRKILEQLRAAAQR